MTKPIKPCVWHQDGDGSDMWGSECGRYFRLDDGTPSDNGMRWCCHCGKPLETSVHEEGVEE
jgi:hypothetical protein